MSSKSDLPAIPSALVDVALIDGPAAAAVGSISLSQWHDLVRRKEAPQPVFREPRCTRWRLLDVRSFWIARTEAALAKPEVAQAAIDRGTRASAAGRAKRVAVAAAAE